MSLSQLSQGRTLAAAALFMAATAGTSFAQCPADDATTTNNDCASAAVGTIGTVTGLSVQGVVEDFWSFSVPPGQILTVDALFIDATADMDLNLFDDGVCGAAVSTGVTTTDNETVVYNNTTAAAVNVIVRVFIWQNPPGSCNDYDLVATLAVDPCLAAVDDGEEDNDTCLTAVAASSPTLAGLFVSQADEDFYTYTLMAGEILDANVVFLDALGDIDAQILDAADCVTVLDTGVSGTDDEVLTYNNITGAAQTVVLRVFVNAASAQGCNTYDLATVISVDPCTVAVDDSFEENDDCTTAAPVSTGVQTGLFVRKEGVDEDWYSIDVLDSATITVTCSFINDDGDIDIDLFDACGGTLLEGSAGTLDTEDVTWTNTTGATVNVKWGVFVWAGDPTEDCNNYDMDVDIQGGMATNLIPYCFGDGSGTACPCGNNSTAGHPGGCGNSAGNGAVLVATGNPTVGADTLNLDLSSASLNSFALLVSGVNQLPQTGGCIGCGLISFDGLRCAGGGFLRHGSRALNGAGETGNGWGPPGGPAGGLIAANGFMVGQTRNFFAFYRDDVAQVCQTGQNSSNGIQVMFN